MTVAETVLECKKQCFNVHYKIMDFTGHWWIQLTG